MQINQKKDEQSDSIDPMKIFVPNFVGQNKNVPKHKQEQMVQLPKLLQEPSVAVGIMLSDSIKFAFDTEFICKETNAIYIGEFDALYKDDVIIFNGECYNQLTFAPASQQNYFAPENHFTLYGVTIGVDFHWQRKEAQSFKGDLKLVIEQNRLRAINNVSVEAYLFSVISSEMSATASLELLKAHAVISRSWLLAPIFNGDEANHQPLHIIESPDEIIKWYERDAHEGFDVCADDHCQRYQGITRAKSDNVRLAIESTSGLVLAENGKICDARFSKCCGGVTELFENCWANVPHNYLQRVVDNDSISYDLVPDLTVEKNAQKWICSEYTSLCNSSDANVLSQVLNNYDQETQDFYRWRVEYTTDEVSRLIFSRSGIDFGTVIDLIPMQRGVSGRIIRLKIVGTKTTKIIGKELEIRRILSESHLYSSAFVVDKTESGFVLLGAGWGHGVGLCQIGAAVMGDKGYNFNQILSHYFVGAEVVEFYG